MRNRALAGVAPAALLALVASCASAGEVTPDARPPADGPRTPEGPPIDAPPVNVCPSALTCQAPTMLGSVSGDTGNQMLTAMGHQSAWFRVRITEDYSDVDGVALSLTARLTSPPGVDFDVFVYLNQGNDAVECSTTSGTTTTSGNVNQTRAVWGETGPFSNGSADDRWVSIEVRPISGTCSPSATWQLVVEGNT